MRRHATVDGLTVQAIAGTHVVLLGLNLQAAARAGVLGFAIHRSDHTEGRAGFLENFLLFADNDTGPTPPHSSERNPFQAFVWGDYSAKPEHDYTYAVTAMRGAPGNLQPGPSVAVAVSTESQDDGTHAVYFNRGVAASQAYARRFENKAPAKVANREAFKWLSRGLEEGLLAFIGQARDARHGLRAAMYQFTYEPVLQAFRLAADAGADVKILYDAVPGEDTAEKNPPAVAAAGLDPIARQRTKISIAHNKFIVLLRDGKPVEVWTGSTNITEGGVFGHANVGHVVRDGRIAARYLDYYKRLEPDPAKDVLAPLNDAAVKIPAGRPRRNSKTAIFSPRSTIDALDWYVQLASKAEQGVFLTAAFGLGVEIKPVFEGDRPFLRYLLLDTERGDIEAVRRDPDNLVTAGGFIGRAGFRQWIAERTTGLNGHVQFVHLKFMLIDPLTDDPTIITGSANWSDESSKKNDENVLVIRGDKRLADIYLGEFMRLFDHYRLRGKSKAKPVQLEPGPAAGARERGALHLRPDDDWADPFYAAGSAPAKERLLFGQPSSGRGG